MTKCHLWTSISSEHHYYLVKTGFISIIQTERWGWGARLWSTGCDYWLRARLALAAGCWLGWWLAHRSRILTRCYLLISKYFNRNPAAAAEPGLDNVWQYHLIIHGKTQNTIWEHILHTNTNTQVETRDIGEMPIRDTERKMTLFHSRTRRKKKKTALSFLCWVPIRYVTSYFIH